MKFLRDKSGVSLMYVLATMMLLMAIGVSAITAAGLNAGAGIVQHNRNQLEIYSSSMERTFKEALDRPEADETSILTANTISGQILQHALMNSGIFADPVIVSAPYSLVPQGSTRIDDFTEINITNITLPPGANGVENVIYAIQVLGNRTTVSGDVIGTLTVRVNPYQRFSSESFLSGYETDGTPIYELVQEFATPLEITISGEVVVRQATTYNVPGGGISIGGIAAPMATRTETTYRLNDVVLYEYEFSPALSFATKVNHPLLSDMRIRNTSSSASWWTVERHATIG